MHRKRSSWLLGLGLTVLLQSGCGDGDADESGRGGTDDGEGSALDAGIAGGGSRDAGRPSGDAPAEENEVTLTLDAPQAGRTSVYVPNPDTNRVAVVNAASFAIESVPVGTQPTVAVAVPGQDVAIVSNAGSRDAALLRTVEAQTRVSRLEVGHDVNTIAVAPDGLHAVLYRNADVRDATAQSFQDLTVVDLAPGAEASHRVSVGFRPRTVSFSRDGRRAFVVTEDGVSIVDFAEVTRGPTIARLVSLGDALATPQSVDVQVTPDGAYALARVPGASVLRLVSLADGRIENLSLASFGTPIAMPDAGVPSEVELTDLDIAPSGAFAVAVLRNRGAIVRIPLPEGFRDPSLVRVRTVQEQLVGSITLARNGTTAIAYTTASPVESVLLIDDIARDTPARGVRLRKAVRAVALSDDGTRALILHAAVPGPQGTPTSEDERIDAAEGYTVLDTTSGFTKLQLTSAAVLDRDLLITPDRSRLFALLRDRSRGVRALDVVDLGSFQIAQLPLALPPTSLGFLPDASRVFVGQSGEGGMITFLDARTGTKVRDVSGFEIASRIRQ